MSKSTTMLRTRRRDNNVKPNRRLDRKSSRGMIYENEELRLRTININAEIERGQYDIKKLKRENEMLKKEIWCLRDEYEKLDKLLKDKEYFSSSASSSSSGSDSESCSSCTEKSEEIETSQNLQNLKNLHTEFDHLSVVPEENSTETSDRTSVPPNDQWNAYPENDIIKPDQSYPQSVPPKNFFAPIKPAFDEDANKSCYTQSVVMVPQPTLEKTSTDLILKTDNQNFTTPTQSTFSNGGNLEELLNDIETISQDILKITNDQQPGKPFKSELNVVLMPNPMPLLQFDKYNDLKKSFENLGEIPTSAIPSIPEQNPFYFGSANLTDGDSSDYYNKHYNPENFTGAQKTESHCDGGSKTNLLELTSSELISSENEENLKFKTTKPPEVQSETKSPKLSIRRKVSIHFKGKKDKKPFFDLKFGDKNAKRPSMESRKSTTDIEPKTPTSSESKSDIKPKKIEEKKQRKSVSISPDRKHVHVKDENRKHRKHKKGDRSRNRRGTVTSVERMNRERSYSACTDRSTEHRYCYDSDRERTNSVSSCETVKTRKMSSISNIPLNGKLPWCGCWGNGCI